MRIPYSCVTTHGGVVFAARGGQIQTFKLGGGPALATWNHPEADREAAVSVESAGASTDKQGQAAGAEKPTPEDEPPAKRQRVEQGAPEESTPEAGTATPQEGEAGENSKGNKKGKKGHGNSRGPISRQPDYHLIIILEVSADGKHLVAVSGNDKTLWVFDHDGNGALKESSKRPMPKRPSGVAISPDSKAIIVADKFGDVYALPLDPADTLAGLATSLSVKHHRDPLKPAANEHTVHSKINLRSLEMQHRALERRDKDAPAPEPPKIEEPGFEHTLILGHVSMLTDVLVEEFEGRRYILTSDRDEHIRVSRYLPQNHIIEAFCLGHKEFVNCLSVSEAYPGVLVSGGGDDELFVWNWQTGALLSKADILSHARAVADVQHVAVSKIASSGSSIFATCEGIPAVFQWTLSEAHTLDKPRTLRLPGNPLDIAAPSSPSPTLLVATCADDEASSEQPASLLGYTPSDKDCNSWVPRAEPFDESAASGSVLEVTPSDSKKIFYTIDSLRKNRAQAEEEDQDA